MIKIRINGKSAILYLVGRLTAEVDYRKLHEAITELVALGVEQIALDMRQVDFLDCSGIGHLLRFQQKLDTRGGSLELINLDRRFLSLLGRAQLLEVFSIGITPVDRLTPQLNTVQVC